MSFLPLLFYAFIRRFTCGLAECGSMRFSLILVLLLLLLPFSINIAVSVIIFLCNYLRWVFFLFCFDLTLTLSVCALTYANSMHYFHCSCALQQFAVIDFVCPFLFLKNTIFHLTKIKMIIACCQQNVL